MKIRKYIPDDCKELIKLFYDTVHTVNAADYTLEQLNAWADGNADIKAWNKSLSEHCTVVAVEDGVIIGFGDIDDTGYLDRLYVHFSYQRMGVASAVCDELEKSFDTITTHASITAKPFFEGRGYKAVKEQRVLRHGVFLTNYVMIKDKTKNPLT